MRAGTARWSAIVLALATGASACGLPPPTREPILPELVLEEPVATFNSRVVALRTSLGRAAIGLELRTTARSTIRATTCDEAPEQRLQAGCVRCELAGEGDPFDSAVLDAIVAAFDQYPAAVLEATRIDKVSLCTSLVYDDVRNDRAIGTVDLRARRLFVSIAPFLHREYDATGIVTTDDIVHHELFHLFEYERMRDAFNDDPQWRLHNPLGFEYSVAGEQEPRKAGFINAYASVAEIEDRASMFQYLMARPAELCAIAAVDANVRAKAVLLWERIAALVDDSFMRARASCLLPLR